MKDEFHQRVFDQLSLSYGWGHSSETRQPDHDRPFRVTELIPNTEAGPHHSRLWIANAKGGLALWVVGVGGDRDAEYSLWQAAVDGALARIGQRTPQAWGAFLAQHPAALPFMAFGIRDEVDLGTIKVTHAGTIATPFLTQVGQVMASEHRSALLRIDGVTDCWAWHGDGEASALRVLRRLVAAISLAWDSPWYLRDGPTEHTDATWHGAPGPVSGSLYRWTDEAEPLGAPRATDLPSWVGAVVDRSQYHEDRDLERALLMHHEGLLTARDHPSLALLAFVAVIESLAARTSPLVRCETCRSFTGSTARFKRAVSAVLEPYEAAQVADAYDRRSRTVHDARLHGREHFAGGWGGMSLYEPDDAFVFEMSTLLLTQKASRAVLWQALGLPGTPTDLLRENGR